MSAAPFVGPGLAPGATAQGSECPSSLWEWGRASRDHGRFEESSRRLPVWRSAGNMAESRTEDPEQAEELCPASGAGELHNKISELRKPRVSDEHQQTARTEGLDTW